MDTVSLPRDLSDTRGWLSDCWSIKPVNPGSFDFRQKERFFHYCRFAEVGLDPCSGDRGVNQIEKPRDEALYLTLYNRGSLLLRSRAEDLWIETGDVVLWDPGSPGSFACSSAIHGLTISFPRPMLERRIGNIDSLYNKKARKGEPKTQLLFSHIVNLHHLADSLAGDQLDSILSSLLDLTYFCVTPSTETITSSYQERLISRVKAAIRERLLEEDLCPHTIAAEFQLSVRRIHSLLALSGLTFSEFVRHERLCRARDALRSASFSSMSITEIAHRFHFFDSAHFSKSFKKRYGISPKEYRKS